MTTLLERALKRAAKAHEGQVRKSDGSPYIVHPVMVAWKLAAHGYSDVVLAAAVTHDLVEDCGITTTALQEELGEEVARIVAAVSEDKALPWEKRKMAYVERLRNADEGAKAVSIADKVHNLESMLAGYAVEGESFWTRFSRGKGEQLWFFRELLSMYRATWDHPLITEYEVLVEKLSKDHVS